MTIASYIGLVAAAFGAGAVNAVAGGGTLLTFPSLLAAGVSPVMANATSTVALVPGSFTSLAGYRKDITGGRRTMIALAVPSLIGGILGAWLVVKAGDSLFSKLVPFLILGATLLFLAQEPISRRLKRNADAHRAADQTAGESHTHQPDGGHLALTAGFQFLVSVYGGFFGAGIGIMMLAALGFLGLTDIHRMNGYKNFAAVCINLIAALTFIGMHRVNWLLAAMMACGAIVGGFGGAVIARRIGQKRVRQIIVAIGFGIAALMFWRQAHGQL